MTGTLGSKRCYSGLMKSLLLNIFIFGVCYIYVEFTDFWHPMRRNQSSTSSLSYDQQIYLYNRGLLPEPMTKSPIKARNVIYKKNSRPRIPSANTYSVNLDTKEYQCLKNDSIAKCSSKTAQLKEKLLIQMTNIFVDEGNVLKMGNLNNTYNVHYAGIREDFNNKFPKQLLCELKNTRLDTIRKADVDPHLSDVRNSMPKRSFFENKFFNSCAVVASSGALRNSNLGHFIDSHEVVLRFNHAPTRKFAADVGTKTTARVLNSQVVTKHEYGFLTSSIFKNVTLVLWDPSNYSVSLEDWLKNPEHNLFPNFIRYKRQEAKPRIFILNPTTIWDVWDFLQRNFPGRLRKNPPSSGFLGLRLLLPHCNFVDVIEYMPSYRASKRCHYFDSEENPACTFGVWHPLSAEKLLTYHLNEASDDDVFQKGFMRIRGLRNLDCSSSK